MRILIVDDHALSRDGLRHLLLRSWPDAEIQEAADFAAARGFLDAHSDPDLVLLDLGLPDLDGLDGLRVIRGQYGPLPVAILSAEEDAEVVRRAITLGALGYIPKSLDSNATAMAISLILNGGTYFPRNAFTGEKAPRAETGNGAARPALTVRQVEILKLIALGKTNQHIAKMLGLSANTIRAHVSAIFKTLGVNNRTEAAAHAMRGRGALDGAQSDMP